MLLIALFQHEDAQALIRETLLRVGWEPGDDELGFWIQFCELYAGVRGTDGDVACEEVAAVVEAVF